MESFINKKTTLIRTICFMAFFVAINVICSLLSVYVPVVSIILIIFLPLTSAVVEINCKDRYFPIYALATIGLSIVVGLSQIDFTIFYIIPSIFTGYIFGLISKKNFPDMFAIFFASLIQTGLSLAFIPLINVVSGTNLFDFIAKILKISDRFWFNTLIVLLFFLVSLIQTILSFIVVDNELKKMGIKNTQNNENNLVANICVFFSAVLTLVFGFFLVKIAYLFMAFAFYFVAFIILSEIKKNKIVLLVVDAGMLLLGIFIYAFTYQLLPIGTDFLLFATIPTLISICSMVDYFLKKSKE